MKKIRSIIKWLLVSWGAVSVLGVLIVGGLIAYHTTIGNRSISGKADKDDVRFVLNWCNLGDVRIVKVIHSHQSARSFTGDHLDAYSIQTSHLEIKELQTDDWQRVDDATGVYKEAIDFMAMWLGNEIPWFPEIDDIRSKKYYIYLWEIKFHGRTPDSVSIILARPADNMVFYFDASM